MVPAYRNTKYCLEIQVALTEELGAIPPPSHSWTTPLVEYMLREVRSGLTEAVVIGPGRAILFYGRCLLGKGLKADKVRDSGLLLIGASTWVGKSTYLTADPVTIPEGKRVIAQAVSDNRVKTRGPGCPPCESAGPTALPVQCPKSISPERCTWRLQS